MSIPLHDVFGVSTDLPKYTYVDRQALDDKFDHYLKSQKHIVVHGASKQGKSCLRKKNIDSNNCVIVHCTPDMESGESLWLAALEAMGITEISKTTVGGKTESKLEAKAEAGYGIPFLGEAKATLDASMGSSSDKSTEEVPLRSGNYLATLATALKDSQKRLILEDFHYLPEDTRKNVAFGMKALYEAGAYILIVGIWSEQNLITFYNGDLTGRMEEINLIWSPEELGTVLSKGEGTLNIDLAPGLKSQLVESACSNVGLLQRLAEKVCIEAGVYESQDENIVIADIDFLHKAREQIISDIRPRYGRIAEVFREGMRSDAVLHIHGRVFNELISAEDAELINGMPLSDLLSRMQASAPGDVNIRQSDLTQCLDRIERLQANRGITPLLVSFSKTLKKVFLNDREFLFYRKYSGDDPEDIKVVFD